MKNTLFAFFVFCLAASVCSAQPAYTSNAKEDYIKLMFVGDINMNAELLDKAFYEEGEYYAFQNFFQLVRPVLNLGDIVVGNLETTFGFPPFGRYPSFTSPEALARSLKYAGFNVLAMANHRLVNADEADWAYHKDVIERNGITMMGAYEDSVDRFENHPLIIEKKNIRIALLNYSQGLGHRTDVFPVVNGTDYDVIEEDIKQAKNRGADYVVVYMHWGREYENVPNFKQQAIARQCFDAGANLVVGTRPKVVQMAETERYFNTGEYRNGLVLYSLGNFSTNITERYSDAGVLLEIILRKDKKTGVTEMVDQAFMPMWGYHYTDVAGDDRYTLLPISQVEQNHVKVTMDPDHQFNMSESGNDIRRKLAGVVNEVQYKLNDTIIEEFNEYLYVSRKPLNDRHGDMIEKEARPELKPVETARRGRAVAIDMEPKKPTSLKQPTTEDMTDNVATVEETIEDNTVYYMVQFMALKRKMEVDTRYYSHLEGYVVKYEDGVYRYMVGRTTSKQEANNNCLDVRRYGHQDAFVVAYQNGKRIDLDQ